MQEAAFIDHVCEPMIRAQKMRTTEGVAAWIAYSTWLKQMGKKVPPQSSFLSSRFFQSFMKFAGFVQQVKTINVEQYIHHMVKHGIQPVIWTSEPIYSEWVRSNITERSPIKQVQSSSLFLLKQAEEKGVDVGDLFYHITAPEVGDWVQTGRVTPWLLLVSTKFKLWFGELDADDRDQLARIINPAEWHERLKGNPNTIVKIKEIAKEIGW